MKKIIFTFAALIIALLALFRLSKYTLITRNSSIEIILTLIATLFFGIGIVFSKKIKFSKKKLTEVDDKKIKTLGLSKREYEVLCQIALGLSNKEIAGALFVSESTIKTHVSNILIKLDAKRRTQAIKIAKEMNIIPL